ncbi:hypothetical protein GQ600_2537 [Phytophthora cactorum]|nr:hypothetical protein GQ600_2537 [Phytophthora cactorum]
MFVDDDTLAQTITRLTGCGASSSPPPPQVLMVDATHNTNDARYKLFSFMIHDVFGHRAVRDIALPKSPPNVLLRYFRLRFLLKSLSYGVMFLSATVLLCGVSSAHSSIYYIQST